MTLATVEAALEDIRAGRFVIVVDDVNRENEGDLVVAAERIKPEHINFMAKYGRGLICVPLTGAFFEKLQIPMMVPPDRNRSRYHTNFGVSVGAQQGITTGISAYDRARTIQVLVDPESKPQDITMPGHVFPIRARDNGVLARRGHTEAAVDLARLAGLRPAGAICEIMDEDGTMARLPRLREFADTHGIRIISIADLVAFRYQHEALVERVESATIPTKQGRFKGIAYRDHRGLEHLAMCFGDFGRERVLVRLHSECLTGDVFASLRCDCGEQLTLALGHIEGAGAGVLLYLRQEGRGIGLANKIKAYALQEKGLDTVEANRRLGFPDDARTYDVGAAILKDLGIHSIVLMTNNPNKVAELKACGIDVVERRAHQARGHQDNHGYLRAKAKKLGHLIED